MNSRPALLLLSSSLLPGGEQYRYRGVHRRNPQYISDAPAEHPANRAFLQYSGSSGEAGILHDVAVATDIARQYASLAQPQHFDVVQVVADGEQALPQSSWLGYDVAAGGTGFSFLAWDLRFTEWTADPDPVIPHIRCIVSVVESHYRPKINCHGLFDTRSDAESFLCCAKALHEARPGLWESNAMDEYTLPALYLVS